MSWTSTGAEMTSLLRTSLSSREAIGNDNCEEKLVLIMPDEDLGAAIMERQLWGQENLEQVSVEVENGVAIGKYQLGDSFVWIVEVTVADSDFVVRYDGRVAEATGRSLLLLCSEAGVDEQLESGRSKCGKTVVECWLFLNVQFEQK